MREGGGKGAKEGREVREREAGRELEKEGWAVKGMHAYGMGEQRRMEADETRSNKTALPRQQ